ncbi:alpha/beta hydrolase [Mameliella sp. CS4]|uniref:alpha/beta fold hydrolase n=1 Tax=Mameliella sp. CS4 TaxID=2862329 RepID=UPI001C5EC6C0|nr:alpha/beta hydrolase [Mameliella sp. CS4]MBW4983631.1 alpha/beta hydrolase [Mameliella sp. CS4]
MNAISLPDCHRPPGTTSPPLGDPLVFLPGLFMTCEAWLPLCRDMGLGNRLLLDLPGHGPNEDAETVTQDLASGKWLDTMLERIAAFSGGRPVHLVGHSSGGLVSLLLARRAQDLVRSLVLVGAPVTGHRDLPRDIGAAILSHDLAGRLSLPMMWRLGLATRGNFERALATVLPRRAAADVPDEMRLALQHRDPEAIRQFGKWVLDQDITGHMTEITQPCLAVIGRQDTVVPPHHQIKLLRRLPQAQARLVPGGHLPFMEHPRTFARALRGWLALDHSPRMVAC